MYNAHVVQLNLICSLQKTAVIYFVKFQKKKDTYTLYFLILKNNSFKKWMQ